MARAHFIFFVVSKSKSGDITRMGLATVHCLVKKKQCHPYSTLTARYKKKAISFAHKFHPNGIFRNGFTTGHCARPFSLPGPPPVI